MEDHDADQLADDFISGIDFSSFPVELTEEMFKQMEDKYEREVEQITAARTAAMAQTDSELAQWTSQILADGSNIRDDVLGSLKDQQMNKVNLKYLLAKDKRMKERFEYDMETCELFIKENGPRDGEMYDDEELEHVLKVFVAERYMQKK